MNCEQALENMDDYRGKNLSKQELFELQCHLDTCLHCREEFRQEEELLSALRGLAVPPPSKDFVKRSFAKARARHTKQRAKQFIPYWGGAIAACLAAWLIVAGPFSQPQTTISEQSGRPAINITINKQRIVQVVVNVPRDMLQANVTIELPPQVEVAGFPGQNEIRWNTNLHKGKNLLSLPLIAKSAGIAELITHISHENKSKRLSLVMNVSLDELTRTKQYRTRVA